MKVSCHLLLHPPHSLPRPLHPLPHPPHPIPHPPHPHHTFSLTSSPSPHLLPHPPHPLPHAHHTFSLILTLTTPSPSPSIPVFSPEFTGQRAQIISHHHTHHLECSDCQYQAFVTCVPLSTKHFKCSLSSIFRAQFKYIKWLLKICWF